MKTNLQCETEAVIANIKDVLERIAGLSSGSCITLEKLGIVERILADECERIDAKANEPRSIEVLNADLMLDDTWIQWTGSHAVLMKDEKVLASFDPKSPKLVANIVRWLDKNSMRCTRIKDGRIWI